jgi:hypothetical protein
MIMIVGQEDDNPYQFQLLCSTTSFLHSSPQTTNAKAIKLADQIFPPILSE